MEHTMQIHLTSFSFFYGKIRVEILVRLSNKSRWVLGVWEVDKSSGVRGFRKWKRKWKLTKVLVMQQMPLQAVKLSQPKPLLLYYGLPILPPWHLLFLLVALSKPLLLVLIQLWSRLRKGSASSANSLEPTWRGICWLSIAIRFRQSYELRGPYFGPMTSAVSRGGRLRVGAMSTPISVVCVGVVLWWCGKRSTSTETTSWQTLRDLRRQMPSLSP